MKRWSLISFYNIFLTDTVRCTETELLNVLGRLLGCRTGLTLLRHPGNIYWSIICEDRGFVGSVTEILPVYDISPLKAKAAEGVALIANYGL